MGLDQQKNLSGALALLQEAMFYAPGDSLVAFALASTMTRLGRHDEAATVLRQIRRAHPNDSETIDRCGFGISNCATDLIAKGQPDRAIRMVREALMEFEHSSMRLCLVVSLNKANRFEEGIAAAREGMARHPGESEWRQALSTALHNYAVRLANQDRYDAAISSFQESFNLAGDQITREMMAQCYASRGVSKANSGNRWGGRQDLQEAARLDPSDSTIRRLLHELS
jgi:tetratricopeptide (TPR) repeat protein